MPEHEAESSALQALLDDQNTRLREAKRAAGWYWVRCGEGTKWFPAEFKGDKCWRLPDGAFIYDLQAEIGPIIPLLDDHPSSALRKACEALAKRWSYRYAAWPCAATELRAPLAAAPGADSAKDLRHQIDIRTNELTELYLVPQCSGDANAKWISHAIIGHIRAIAGLPAITFDEAPEAPQSALKSACVGMQHVEVAPDRHCGWSVLKGTRFPVARVIAELAEGGTVKGFCRNYGQEIEAVRGALRDVAQFLDAKASGAPEADRDRVTLEELQSTLDFVNTIAGTADPYDMGAALSQICRVTSEALEKCRRLVSP